MTPPTAPASDPAFRAGQIGCACPNDADRTAVTDNRFVLTLAFAIAVLAQALTLTVLPEQGRLLAPTAAGVGLPFALMLIGAAVASFPATLLIDAFGRRAAFGLGASLGAAGGALCAFAAIRGNFFALSLGAFWMGLAQGFALFYRHVAAQGSARAALTVFGGGAVAALATPVLVGVAGEAVKTLMTAGALHILALAVVIRLPHRRGDPNDMATPARAPAGFLLATLAGALAWGVMAAGMLHGPLTLAACSASPVFIGGAMGWHLASMYAPAVLAARWPALVPPGRSMIAGLLLAFTGAAAVHAGASIGWVTAGLIAIGVGWSLVNVSCLGLLHAGAPPSRRMLAVHDFCLLSAAVLGALL